MTNFSSLKISFTDSEVFKMFSTNRVLRHVAFWFCYYLFFSLIWMKPQLGYLASFYLEFILLPIRIMAAYIMMYWLVPHHLANKRYQDFAIYYLLLILVAGALQRVFDHYFYQNLLLNSDDDLFNAANYLRSIVLINTTVMLALVFKVFQLFLQEQEKAAFYQQQLETADNNPICMIALKSNRRIHHVNVASIQYIEGMGNYVSYYLDNGERLVVYSSIKACLDQLPEFFIRVNRSCVINLNQLQSYSGDDVTIGDKTISRGANITDEMLSL